MASKPIKAVGLELVLSNAEKSCIASYYKQFSTNISIKIYKMNNSFVSPGPWPLEANKNPFPFNVIVNSETLLYLKYVVSASMHLLFQL